MKTTGDIAPNSSNRSNIDPWKAFVVIVFLLWLAHFLQDKFCR